MFSDKLCTFHFSKENGFIHSWSYIFHSWLLSEKNFLFLWNNKKAHFELKPSHVA